MIDGNYLVRIDTLLIPQMSLATLKTEGDTVYVDIEAPIIGRRTSEGKVDGNTFVCEGRLDVDLIGEITYTLSGEVDGDDIHIVIASNKGEFNFSGRRA